MQTIGSFGEVLEAADSLSVDEQESLIDILHRRLIEHHRAELAQAIQDARQEFQQGLCQPATTAEIMDELLS
jgi:hypothetical protein